MNTIRWQAILLTLLITGCASAVPAQSAPAETQAAPPAPEALAAEAAPATDTVTTSPDGEAEATTETGLAGVNKDGVSDNSKQKPDAAVSQENDQEPGKFLGRGKASYYHDKFHGRRTASGARFNQQAMTAAHRTLPFGTRVRVTNIRNGKSVVVTINDRGPYGKGRVIDLSRAAAQALGLIHHGLTEVRLSVLKRP